MADFERIICEGRAWSCDWALRVVGCESGMNAHAQNPLGSDYGSLGLWQIHYPSHRANVGPDPTVLYDPVFNTDYAERLFLDQGVTPWLSSQVCWGGGL